MTEQDLDRPKVAGPLVDQRRLGPAQRMSAEQGRVQPDRSHPLIYQAGVLPRAYMGRLIDPAGEQELLRPAASTAGEPDAEAFPSRLAYLK